MAKLENYLNTINENLKIHGIKKILESLDKTKIKKFERRFPKSTFYYWISGRSPIPIKILKHIIKDRETWDNVFNTFTFLSTGSKMCKLPREINLDLAYLIGVIHGDGSVSKDLQYVTITTEGKDYLEEINKLFESIFDLTGQINVLNKRGTCYRLTIGSKTVHSFLSHFCPVGRKKNKLSIPKVILDNNDLLKHYLAGLFDTDGSFPHTEKGVKSRFFLFTQSSVNFVEEIYEALKKLQIPVNKPRPFLSTNSPYDRRRQLIESRIYLGSGESLKTLIQIIPFRHKIKKSRALCVMNSLNGSARIRTGVTATSTRCPLRNST